MEKETIVIIMCPPLSKYPEKPNDISKCELIPCPHCQGDMWFSVKKKGAKELSEQLGIKIYFGCHDCFKDEIEKGAMKDFEVRKISI